MKVSAVFLTFSIVLTINVKEIKSDFVHRASPLAHKSEEEVNWTSGSAHIPKAHTLTLTQEHEDEVEWFVAQLKLYVHEKGIDAAEFESKIDALDAQFAEIAEYAETSEHQRLGQLRFASHLLQTIKDTIRYLRFFDAQNTAQRIVRSLLQLNVWLLALHDSHGNPDPQRNDYAMQIAVCSHAAFSWAEIFHQEPSVPLSVTLMFEKQYHKAKYTLSVMESHHLDGPYVLPRL